MAISEKNLPDLRNYLSKQSFTNKFLQTSQLIKKFDGLDLSENINVLKVLYEDLLYEFPFTHTWWNRYANVYITLKQYEQAVQIFQQAVYLNPTDVELWNAYTSVIVQLYGKNSPDTVTDVFEKAVQSVNLDPDSQKILTAYLTYLETNEAQNLTFKADELYWKLLTFPLSNVDEIIDRYGKFIDNLEQPVYFQISELHKDLNLPGDKIINRAHLKNAYGKELKQAAAKNTFADDKKKLDEIFENRKEFDGTELEAAQEKTAKQYLEDQEKRLSHEKLVFLYRKALIQMSNDGSVWYNLLHILNRNESTQSQVNETFTKYDKLFKIVKNKENILLFKADLLESNQDIAGCREIYTFLEEQKIFEAYIRHIYMEIRNNQLQNVVKIFSSLSEVVTDGDQVAFVVQEMGDILNKLGEADRAAEIIKGLSAKQGYSKFFFATWINFLKNCKKPWEDIDDVFQVAFKKAAKPEEKTELWKLYLYTSRSYCNDIAIIRDVEKKYILKEEPEQENGVNKKRRFEYADDNSGVVHDPKKQVKTD